MQQGLQTSAGLAARDSPIKMPNCPKGIYEVKRVMFVAMPYLQSRRKDLFSLHHCKRVKEVEVTIQHYTNSPFFFLIRNIHTSSYYVFNLEHSE